MEPKIKKYEPEETCEDWCETCTLIFAIDHITDPDRIADQIANRILETYRAFEDMEDDNPDLNLILDVECMLHDEIGEAVKAEGIKCLESEQYDPGLSWQQPCVMVTFCECCGEVDIMIGDYKDAAKELWPDEMKEEWEQHCTPILSPNHANGELLAEIFHGVDNIYEAEPNYNPYIKWDDPAYLDDPNYKKYIDSKKRVL